MSKSNYHYFFNRGVLCIIDENRGNMSVTNCIEDVVHEICENEGIDKSSLLVIYKDSDGIWDGWDDSKQSFILINQKNIDDAIDKIKKIL